MSARCATLRRLLAALAACLLAATAQARDCVLVSCNVWMDDASGQAGRYEQLLADLATHDADLIALQEVTPALLERLAAFAAQHHYRLLGGPIEEYGNLILTRLEVTAFQELRLPSHMGRKALIATVLVAGAPTVFACVHLDSMLEDTERRKLQLQAVFAQVGSKRAVVLGDCNFGDGEAENVLAKDYVDTGASDLSPTFDREGNAHARVTGFNDEKSRRIDRIFHSPDLTLDGYHVFRNEDSDHYAIGASLR